MLTLEAADNKSNFAIKKSIDAKINNCEIVTLDILSEEPNLDFEKNYFEVIFLGLFLVINLYLR